MAALALVIDGELLRMFVDGEVGQVHVRLLHVALGGGLVRLGAEAREPLLEEQHAQRRRREHEHVESQVEPTVW